MPVLGLDTAGRNQSVAIAQGGVILAEFSINAPSSHSETLLGTVDLVLSKARMATRSLTAIAVTRGPGAFTGLRIGMATAKGLALPAGLPLAGRSTLAVLAAALSDLAASVPGTMVCALIDAGRGQVYRGLYRAGSPRSTDGTAAPMGEDSICDPGEALRDLEESCIIGGEGTARLPANFPSSLPSGALVIESVPPLAPWLALMVEQDERAGLLGSHALVPNYVREADARPPTRP